VRVVLHVEQRLGNVEGAALFGLFFLDASTAVFGCSTGRSSIFIFCRIF
jgi:hypothetical protein